jgi:hypothetical protein
MPRARVFPGLVSYLGMIFESKVKMWVVKLILQATVRFAKLFPKSYRYKYFKTCVICCCYMDREPGEETRKEGDPEGFFQ